MVPPATHILLLKAIERMSTPPKSMLLEKLDVRVTQVMASVDVRSSPYLPPIAQRLLPKATVNIVCGFPWYVKFDVLVVHVIESVDVLSCPLTPAATHRLLPKETEWIIVLPKFEVCVTHVIASVDVRI